MFEGHLWLMKREREKGGERGQGEGKRGGGGRVTCSRDKRPSLRVRMASLISLLEYLKREREMAMLLALFMSSSPTVLLFPAPPVADVSM